MNKITLLAAFFILSIPFHLESQDTLLKNTFPVESSGSRVILDINSRYIKNSGDAETLPFIEQVDIRGAGLASIWKYGKKINYLVSLSLSENYSFDEGKDQIHKFNIINGDFYGSTEYYFQPGKPYINGSYSLRFLRDYRYSRNFYEWDSTEYEYCSFNAGHLIWISAGYGRLINHARVDKLANIENVLFKNKIIKVPLSNSVKKKLLILTEKRNNRDYQAKFKDDDEIRFMDDLEKLLLQEKVISSFLGAETVMKIYQAITNKKFVYYPEFRGLQTQLELQYNPTDEASYHDYATLSSHYGFGISDKTNSLLSGFFSIPLRSATSAYYLFGYHQRNPFNNVLPMMAELYGLDIYSPDFYGDPRGTLYEYDLEYLAGLKFHVFHSFTNTIGMYLWGQGIAEKPKATGYRNSLMFGMQIDFNVLSFIYLSGGVNWLRKNDGYSQINSKIGTSLILF